jgi:hypothetical protein
MAFALETPLAFSTVAAENFKTANVGTFIVEMMELALKKSGISFVREDTPWNKHKRLADQGKFDFYICNDTSPSHFLRSKTAYTFTYSIWQNIKETPFADTQKIEGKQIIAMLGSPVLSHLGEKNKYEYASNVPEAVEMFARGRASYLASFIEYEALLKERFPAFQFRRYDIIKRKTFLCINSKTRPAAKSELDKIYASLMKVQDSPEGKALRETYKITTRFGE